MEEKKYTFSINVIKDFDELKYINKIYEVKDVYFKLDDVGKTLISEIIRFCENEERFPTEKDMRNNRGYISSSQFDKYFKGGWTEIYNYIIYIEEPKPLKYKCNKCGEEKDFNSKNFGIDKNSKFGLKKICIACNTKYAYERNIKSEAKKHNISISDIYNPVIWYDKFISDNMKQMPKICYTEENLIKIIRYIVFDKLGIKNEYELITNLTTPMFKKYRLVMIVDSFNGKYNMFKKCFPEFEFKDVKQRKYISDNMIETVIENWIVDNKYKIEDILKMSLKDSFNKEMTTLVVQCFENASDAIMWYTERKNILHPIYNRNIRVYDFAYPQKGYFSNVENRIERVKEYCELECKENILDCIGDTELLKEWVYKYFKSSDVCKLFDYSHYNNSLYATLIEAYPQIIDNKILFEWEWHQCSKNDREFLIQAMRDFIYYRFNNIILDIQRDVPIYMNRSIIKEIEPKLNKQIDRNRFKDYYEWCCLAFPEFADDWTPQGFDECIAYDSAKCGSMQELMVYEFLKRDMGFKYIQNIGNKRAGKYTFKLDETYAYERFCPDFIIEYDNLGNKLSKPIVLEYYGMYDESHTNQRFINYTRKTKSKNSFYNSLNTINFIAIYPIDIKNNFDTLVNKMNKYKDVLFNNKKVS